MQTSDGCSGIHSDCMWSLKVLALYLIKGIKYRLYINIYNIVVCNIQHTYKSMMMSFSKGKRSP